MLAYAPLVGVSLLQVQDYWGLQRQACAAAVPLWRGSDNRSMSVVGTGGVAGG